MIDISAIPFWAWWFFGIAVGGWITYFICTHRKDGLIHVHLGKGEEKDTYLFEFNVPPEEIPSMSQIVFKVQLEEQKIQSP